MDKIEIEELKNQAVINGCLVFVSPKQDRLIATDGTGIMIATPEGKVRVPIVELKEFTTNIEGAIKKCVETFAKLELDHKNRIALGQGTSYGKLREVITTLTEGKQNE